MVNHSFVDVLGIETVVLTLTFGETIILNIIKYVLTIAKNLIFGSLLCKVKMSLDFQGGKTILLYKKIYFGNDYKSY